MKFSDQLRDALRQAIAEGKQQQFLATAAEMDQGNLSAFLKGKRGLSLASIDLLAEYLGWSLNYPTTKPKLTKSSKQSNQHILRKSKKSKE